MFLFGISHICLLSSPNIITFISLLAGIHDLRFPLQFIPFTKLVMFDREEETGNKQGYFSRMG